ncbi:MAG: hypothetical protein JWL81_838 [Verrucomicrobiales bacterium]|nr:hypothetical protein [Verrucomicrobiales bacterium]
MITLNAHVLDRILDFTGPSGFTKISTVIAYSNPTTMTGATDLSFITTA